jgi:type IX secretion system PorP/SprF family membrane protein
MMKRLVTAILTLFICTAGYSQKHIFSQYYKASLFLNPAFAGIYNAPQLNSNFNVANSDNENFQQQKGQVSVIFPIMISGVQSKQIGGIGVTGFTLTQGIKDSERISAGFLTYAQTIKLSVVSPDIISVGAQVGYETYDVSLSNLSWGSQYSPFLGDGFDPTRPTPITDYDNRTSHVSVNAGIMYMYNRERNYLLYNYSAFSGISVTNVNRPDVSVNKNGEFRTPIQLIYHGAFEFQMKRMFIIPSALVRYVAGNDQYNLGTYLTYATSSSRGFSLDSRGLELVFGTWYRLRDSFTFIAGVNHDNYSVNISYDLNSNVFFTESSLAPVDNLLLNPAFEISITYTRSRDSRLRKVSNPLF